MDGGAGGCLGFVEGGGGQLSDICSAEARGQAAAWHRRLQCWRRWHEAGLVQQAVDGLNGEPFAQTA